MVEHGQTLLVCCCRQLKLLREEGKLPKGGLEAGKLHGLTEADLKGPVLNIFKPSQSDVERLEYVPCLLFRRASPSSHAVPGAWKWIWLVCRYCCHL